MSRLRSNGALVKTGLRRTETAQRHRGAKAQGNKGDNMTVRPQDRRTAGPHD